MNLDKYILIYIDCGSNGPKFTGYDINNNEITTISDESKTNNWNTIKLTDKEKLNNESINNLYETKLSLVNYFNKIIKFVKKIYAILTYKGFNIESIECGLTGELRTHCIYYNLPENYNIKLNDIVIKIKIIKSILEARYQQYSSFILHYNNNERYLNKVELFSNIHLNFNKIYILVIGGSSTQLFCSFRNENAKSFRFGKYTKNKITILKELNKLNKVLNNIEYKHIKILITGSSVSRLLNKNYNNPIHKLIKKIPIKINIKVELIYNYIQNYLTTNSYFLNTKGFNDIKWRGKWCDTIVSLNGDKLAIY
jgi:hypothetical protein